MRFLLDTNVVLSAFRSRLGASHALLRRALGREIQLVMHYKLASEYREVLSRYLPIEEGGVTFSDAERVLTRLVADADEIDVRYLWRPNLRDEGDNFIYEIAVASSPCTIVTYNLRDFAQGEIRFSGVYVKTPAEVLQSLTH
jgi:predicted nucleic acid-binding protein